MKMLRKLVEESYRLCVSFYNKVLYMSSGFVLLLYIHVEYSFCIDMTSVLNAIIYILHFYFHLGGINTVVNCCE